MAIDIFSPDATFESFEDRERQFQAQLQPGPAQFNTLFGRSKKALAPRFNSALFPGLSASAASETSKRGGILPAGTLPGSINSLALQQSLSLANQLAGLRTIGAQIEQGLPPSVNVGQRAAEGALEGFVAGGGVGAIPGAVGGYLSGKGDREARDELRGRVYDIFKATEPAAFGRDLDETRATTREAALASGAGARAEQSLQKTISLTGLRGTPIGSLAALSAGSQEDLLALGANFQQALKSTSERVASLAGSPIEVDRDPLARALEGIADAVLAFNQGRNKGNDEFQGPEIDPRTGARVPGAGPDGTARVLQNLPGAFDNSPVTGIPNTAFDKP